MFVSYFFSKLLSPPPHKRYRDRFFGPLGGGKLFSDLLLTGHYHKIHRGEKSTKGTLSLMTILRGLVQQRLPTTYTTTEFGLVYTFGTKTNQISASFMIKNIKANVHFSFQYTSLTSSCSSAVFPHDT